MRITVDPTDAKFVAWMDARRIKTISIHTDTSIAFMMDCVEVRLRRETNYGQLSAIQMIPIDLPNHLIMQVMNLIADKLDRLEEQRMMDDVDEHVQMA